MSDMHVEFKNLIRRRQEMPAKKLRDLEEKAKERKDWKLAETLGLAAYEIEELIRDVKAIRSQVIEECAKVADDWGTVGPEIAKAIRALSTDDQPKKE